MLSTERVSSHNEEGLEIVEKLLEMRWIDEEMLDFTNSLMGKYRDDGEVELHMSNIAFEPCDMVERVCSFDTEQYFMFQGDTIVKLLIRPPFNAS